MKILRLLRSRSTLGIIGVVLLAWACGSSVELGSNDKSVGTATTGGGTTGVASGATGGGTIGVASGATGGGTTGVASGTGGGTTGVASGTTGSTGVAGGSSTGVAGSTGVASNTSGSPTNGTSAGGTTGSGASSATAATAGSDGGSGLAVFTPGDLSFSLHVWGGLPWGVPLDAACRSTDYNETYVFETRTLSIDSCTTSGRIARTVTISDAQAATLVEALLELHTSDRLICASDGEYTDLTITDKSSQSRAYHGDYACLSPGMPPPPYASSEALLALGARLGLLIPICTTPATPGDPNCLGCGSDLICNEDLVLGAHGICIGGCSAARGTCLPDGTCMCTTTKLNPATGKCQ